MLDHSFNNITHRQYLPTFNFLMFVFRCIQHFLNRNTFTYSIIQIVVFFVCLKSLTFSSVDYAIRILPFVLLNFQCCFVTLMPFNISESILVLSGIILALAKGKNFCYVLSSKKQKKTL